MDAVELNYPVDVAAPSLVGSEAFGGDRAAVEVVDACELKRVSVLVNSRDSIEGCSSLLSEKDATNSVNGVESTLLDKVPDAELFRYPSQLPSFPSEVVSKKQNCSGTTCPSRNLRHEGGKVQRKAVKVSRSSSGCSKRQRIAQLEDTTCPSGVDAIKDLSDKLGAYPTKCDSHEKSQLVKQKNNFVSKRGDRRNFKVSTKTKCDSFSVKAGLASFSLAAGGNNFFGLNGLKTDVHDITKLVDDVSLNDLLDGTYECPSLGKDKGKKAANTTDNILQSVRKACFILQLPRTCQFQNFSDIDEKMPACPSSSAPIVANGDTGDSSTTDLSSSNKDSCSKPETLAASLDFSFDKPRDTWERLALPPPKDLESLLLEAAKPAVSSRSATDPRPTKQTSRRASLPSFSWSHAYSGHCRTNSEAVKFPTSRSTCQGRWVRIGNTTGSLGSASDHFTKLESLTYDENLVPSHRPKMGILDNNVASSIQGPSCGWGSLLASHVPLGSGDDMKYQGKVEHCPRLLAAAQTLCDIATRANQDRIARWPKKASLKASKTRKSKLKEKPGEVYATSISLVRSKSSGMDQMMPAPSKRPKLSAETKNNAGHINGVGKGSINWSTPKSSRSLPNKAVRDLTATSVPVKRSFTMPSAAKVPSRACNGQQKVRKLMQMDWNRDCDRQD